MKKIVNTVFIVLFSILAIFSIIGIIKGAWWQIYMLVLSIIMIVALVVDNQKVE